MLSRSHILESLRCLLEGEDFMNIRLELLRLDKPEEILVHLFRADEDTTAWYMVRSFGSITTQERTMSGKSKKVDD